MNTCTQCNRQLPPGQCCGDDACPLNQSENTSTTAAADTPLGADVIAGTGAEPDCNPDGTGSVSTETETTGETGATTVEGAQ